MLSIIYKEPNKELQELQVHVGQDTKKAFNRIAVWVDNIQADGDELEYIRRLFTPILNGESLPITIPMPRKAVVRWYGDFAKMIVGNW